MTIDQHYEYPDCPKCSNKLINIVSDRVLMSCPPQYEFACGECDFIGYVRLNHSPEYEKMFKIAKGNFEFSDEIRITNQKWINNLMNTSNQEKS